MGFVIQDKLIQRVSLAMAFLFLIWAGMSMHMDSIIIKNTEHTPKSGHMRRHRWIYMALPVTVIAVLIGMMTNTWSPYAPFLPFIRGLIGGNPMGNDLSADYEYLI